MDSHVSSEHDRVGRDLVFGALAGAAAVWVLDRVDWFMFRSERPETRARTRKARPHGMDPAHAMAQRAARAMGFALEPKQPNLPGMLMHYNLGIGPGALYSVAVDRFPVLSRGRGLLYGFGLFALQDELLNHSAGFAGKFGKYPWQAHARGLIAHLVYGVAMDTGVRVLKHLFDSTASSRAPMKPTEVDEQATWRAHSGSHAGTVEAARPG